MSDEINKSNLSSWEEFCEKLKAANLTKEEFCELSGMSYSSLSNWRSKAHVNVPKWVFWALDMHADLNKARAAAAAFEDFLKIARQPQ